MFHQEVISGKTGRCLGKGRRPSSGVTSSKDQGSGDSDPQGSPGDGSSHFREVPIMCGRSGVFILPHLSVSG